jgi:hypothetical protein
MPSYNFSGQTRGLLDECVPRRLAQAFGAEQPMAWRSNSS